MSDIDKPAALARVESSSALGLSGGVQINGLRDVFALAERLSNARGFVPDVYVGKPESLAAVILTGVELGLGPMTAMREIHVIKGKPTISATLMLSLARRAGVKTRWVKSDATVATIGVTVPGIAEQTMSFTLAEAQAAGVMGNETWKKYPAAMLRARATSAAIRAFCPDVIGGGIYESESGEITEGVPSSDVIDVTPEPAPRTEPKPSGVPKQLPKIETAEMLAAWCEQWGPLAAKDPRNAAHLTAAAKRLGVDPVEALTAAGFTVTPHDPETGEVTPDQEPA